MSALYRYYENADDEAVQVHFYEDELTPEMSSSTSSSSSSASFMSAGGAASAVSSSAESAGSSSQLWSSADHGALDHLYSALCCVPLQTR